MSSIKRIAVIDYGMGNINSVRKALKVAGAKSIDVTSEPDSLRRADSIVLPGVGAMGDCVSGLASRGLDSALIELIGNRPLLAICIGMHVLTVSSEENLTVKGLGFFPVNVKRFQGNLLDSKKNVLKIPHMGWNRVWFSSHPILNGINQGEWFYFVHSYRIPLDCNINVAATCYYGEPFVAGLSGDGVYAVQFHPEKSYLSGINIYKNFLKWDGS